MPIKMKKVTQPPVQLNVLEEKKMQLAVLQNQSNEAVSVFVNAIQQMKAINTEIEVQKEDIAKTIDELLKTKTALSETEFANNNMIKKFEGLLSVQE